MVKLCVEMTDRAKQEMKKSLLLTTLRLIIGEIRKPFETYFWINC